MNCIASNKTATEKLKHDYVNASVECLLVFTATYLEEKLGLDENETLEALKWINKEAALTTSGFTDYKTIKNNLVFNTGILVDKGDIYHLGKRERRQYYREHGTHR